MRFSRSSDCSRKDCNHGSDNLQSLILRDKRRNPHGDVRLGRKTAAHAQCVTDLVRAIHGSFDRGQRNVVDLRVRSTSSGQPVIEILELARQIVRTPDFAVR